MKYVHSSCLSDWVFYHRSLTCEVCGTTYSVAKVLSCQRNGATCERYLDLLWICMRRFMRQNLHTLLWALFRVLALMLPILCIAVFYRVFGPLLSPNLPWSSVTLSWIDVGDYSFSSSLAASVEIMLLQSPIFFLWDAWRGWYASNEDILVGVMQLEAEEMQTAAERFIPNERLTESDEEPDEEFLHTTSENHALEPARLPEENATILEAIVSARYQRKDFPNTHWLIPSSMLRFSTRFILFYLSLWLLFKLIPEGLHRAATVLWGLFDGTQRCATGVEQILMVISESSGVARVRCAMLFSFAEAVISSSMVSWTLTYGRRMLAVWLLLFCAKRLTRMPYRKTIASTVIYLRGILNLLMLVHLALPTVCFLTMVLSLDFFAADTSFDADDYKAAWKLLGLSSMKRTSRVYSTDLPHAVESPSPVTILKALNTLSQAELEDQCWNFGDTCIVNSTMTSNNEVWTVEGNDPWLFPLFAATVFVSKVDIIALITTGYMAVFFAAFVYGLLCIGVASLPRGWVRWSSLCRILHANVYQVISFFDVKTLLLVYGEVVALTVFALYILLRNSLTLVRVIDPTVLPVMFMEGANASSSVCWVRVLFLIYTAPQEIFEALHQRITGAVGSLFEIGEVMQRGPISLPQYFSRVVRVTAFAACYWISIVLLMTAYTIPGIYMVTRRMGIARGILFAHLNAYKGVRFIYPNALPVAVAQMRNLALQVPSMLVDWKQKWWISSCLGLWLKKRLNPGENLFSYELARVHGMPSDVRFEFAFEIETTCARLREYTRDGNAYLSLQRIESALKCHLSSRRASANTCYLTEEDVSLLHDCLRLPSVQHSLRFFLTWVILVLVFPCLVGAAVLSFLRSLFSTPHCYTGPLISMVLMSWLLGILVMLLLCIRKTARINLFARLRLYLFCGCHHFTTMGGVVFVVVPIFVQVGAVTIVPYALHNALLPLILRPGDTPALNPFIFLAGVLEALNLTGGNWTRREVARRVLTRLRDVVGQGPPVTDVPSAGGSDAVEASTRQDGALEEESNGGEAPRTFLMRTIDASMRLCRKSLAWAKFKLHTVGEASVIFLKKMAERESVMTVIFVDRPVTAE
ncbi:hypothetical protein DQ04_00031030 [Trypanosoma grayi]|uniref:hypothetical protein n=1 Tax=Trypanosoma grayi TaxID=71804 RepID=UPI0004F48CC3|nr:hypothetical protein DQ04_00031030 [Trypanosoma grayi]KEG15569.1 hypothetical protein DQ04_00031030 [Trypanosoma grayi]